MDNKELESLAREYIKQKNREYINELIICGMRNSVIILLVIIGMGKIFGVRIESFSLLIVTSITAGFLSYLSMSSSILKLEKDINNNKLDILERLCVFEIAISKIADKIDYEHIIAESELEFEEMMKDDK